MQKLNLNAHLRFMSVVYIQKQSCCRSLLVTILERAKPQWLMPAKQGDDGAAVSVGGGGVD